MNYLQRLLRTVPWLLVAIVIVPNVHAQARVEIGKGFAICEALAKEINRSTPVGQLMTCEMRLLRRMRGVTEPAWTELDVKKHESLIREIYIAHRMGERSYVLARRRGQDPVVAFSHFKVGEIDAFMARVRDGKYRMLMAKIEMMGRAPGKETIIQLQPTEPCESPLPTFVNAELNAIDDTAFESAVSLGSGAVINYFGRPYFVRLLGGFGFGAGRGGQFIFTTECEIQLHNIRFDVNKQLERGR